MITKRWIIFASFAAFILIILSLLMHNLQRQYDGITHAAHQPFLRHFMERLDQMNQISFHFADNNIALVKVPHTNEASSVKQEHWVVQQALE